MNIPDLFVVLVGYWPHSAPDIDDPVAVLAHQDILGDFQPDAVLDAVREIARTGREFCPPPGVIAANVGRTEQIPLNHAEHPDALTEGNPVDPETARRYLAEIRALADSKRLPGEPSEVQGSGVQG